MRRRSPDGDGERVRESPRRAPLDLTPAGILWIGPDYRIQAANGWAAEQLHLLLGRAVRVGDSIFDYLNEGNLRGFNHCFHAAVAGRSARMERAFRGACAAERWLAFDFSPADLVGSQTRGVCLTIWSPEQSWRREVSVVDADELDESSVDAVIGETLVGTIVSWSRGAERLYGYAAEEMIGQPTSILVPADRPHELPAILARVRRGERIEQYDTVRVDKDGRRVDVAVRISPVRDVSGRVIGASSVERDISRHKLAEQQLREREQQYYNVFEAASDGLVIVDLVRNVVIDANPAACWMHGYTREEFIDRPPTDWIHPDFHTLFSEYTEMVRAGGQFLCRAVHRRKDGSTLHAEVLGRGFVAHGQVRMLAVIRDVTEQVRAYEVLEQRVAERTRELSTLLSVSQSVASILDLKTLLGVVLDQLKGLVDYRVATLCGLEGERLVLLDYRGPAPRDEVVHRRWEIAQTPFLAEALRQRAPVITADVHGPSLDGVDVALQRLFYGDAGAAMAVPLIVREQLFGVLSFAHETPGFYGPDHSRLALAIANQAAVAIENARLYERAQSLAALDERQRLARELHDSVSQALYGIALGARTARTLLDRDPARVGEPLDYVLSLADAGLAEMRTLIFELRPESLALEGLVAALTKRVEFVRARHGIVVRADFCDEPDVPYEIKEALYRIAQEATNNTVKHARATEVTIGLAEREGDLVLEVSDDGAGFDPQGSYPGHLGLRSMRERANRLGGTIEVESAPGHGTRLRARIPVRSPLLTGLTGE